MKFSYHILCIGLIAFLASCGIPDPAESGLTPEQIAQQNESDIAVWSANNPDIDLIRTESGLAYAIFEQGNGVFPTPNDTITMDFDLLLGAGRPFTSTGIEGFPIVFPLNTFVPGLIEGLQLLSPGGSGVFLIPGDLGFTSFPQGIENDDLLIYVVDFIDINGQFEGVAENMDIEAYLTQNNLVADTITDSGIRMIFLEEGNGTGRFARAGGVVEVDYHGTLLDGTIFDTTRGRVPLTFGLEQVIPGWQEAIPLIEEGATALMIIPSASAYGRRPPIEIIPQNATLVFEVTVNAVL